VHNKESAISTGTYLQEEHIMSLSKTKKLTASWDKIIQFEE